MSALWVEENLSHQIAITITKVSSKNGNAIGTAGAIAPPQKEESILVGRALTMETILCLIKASYYDMKVCMFSFNLECVKPTLLNRQTNTHQ